MKFFGSYVSSLDDIELTRQVLKNGKEKSSYAIVSVNENDLEEVLTFDGTTAGGRQIVVERTKSSTRTPHPEGMEKTKRQGRSRASSTYRGGVVNQKDNAGLTTPNHAPSIRKTGSVNLEKIASLHTLAIGTVLTRDREMAL